METMPVAMTIAKAVGGKAFSQDWRGFNAGIYRSSTSNNRHL
ncbi:hypothetical protein QF001_003935 [Paraburkholderia youngii]